MGPIRPITRLGYTGNCALCTYPLVVKFPKDFPDDWKWCCGCLALAKGIIEYPPLYLEDRDMEEDESLFVKIYNKMTLAEGNV